MAAVLAVLCVAVVAALAVRYAGQTRAGSLDASVDGWIQDRLGARSPLLSALTWLGDPVPVTVMTVLMALGCALARWWRGVALAALTVPVASGLTEGLLKPFIGRTIDGALSLPSGHTTAVVTLATLVAVLLSRRLPAPARGPLIMVVYLLAAAVAAAMIAQGFHYFTDTIAGAAVGTATVLIGAFVIDAAAGPLRARIGVPAGDSAEGPARSAL
jgi:undecaprenyl-diphosphatase